MSRGVRLASPHFVAAGFAEPAFVWGHRGIEGEMAGRYYTAGIALNGQFYLRPFSRVGTVAGIPLGGLGIGVDVQANVNPVQPATGAGVGLYLGTLL